MLRIQYDCDGCADVAEGSTDDGGVVVVPPDWVETSAYARVVNPTWEFQMAAQEEYLAGQVEAQILMAQSQGVKLDDTTREAIRDAVTPQVELTAPVTAPEFVTIRRSAHYCPKCRTKVLSVLGGEVASMFDEPEESAQPAGGGT